MKKKEQESISLESLVENYTKAKKEYTQALEWIAPVKKELAAAEKALKTAVIAQKESFSHGGVIAVYSPPKTRYEVDIEEVKFLGKERPEVLNYIETQEVLDVDGFVKYAKAVEDAQDLVLETVSRKATVSIRKAKK